MFATGAARRVQRRGHIDAGIFPKWSKYPKMMRTITRRSRSVISLHTFSPKNTSLHNYSPIPRYPISRPQSLDLEMDLWVVHVGSLFTFLLLGSYCSTRKTGPQKYSCPSKSLNCIDELWQVLSTLLDEAEATRDRALARLFSVGLIFGCRVQHVYIPC